MFCSSCHLLFRNQKLIHIVDLWYSKRKVVYMFRELITGLLSIIRVLKENICRYSKFEINYLMKQLSPDETIKSQGLKLA